MSVVPPHSIPKTMQAIAIDSGRLIPTELPVPTPAAEEILIQVACAGLNRADIFQRQGSYPPPEGASPLPGLEVSGTVVAVGNNVTQWQVGDTVCALLSGGGYAQYVTCHAEHVFPVPQGWSMEEAAALPEALFTVWMALQVEAKLLNGETVLIHGGASGIGMIATQYATWLGATTYTTAGTPEKCAASERWGAKKSIPYKEADFVPAVLEATNGRGVDVVLDMVGGDYIARNFKALATDGRMVSIAFLRGAKPEGLSVAPLLMKRLLWKGATLRSRSAETKALWQQQIQKQLWPALESGAIRPVVDCCFTLTDAEKAHQYMEENLNIGKIVLQIGNTFSYQAKSLEK